MTPLSDAALAEIAHDLFAGQKIQAIKAYRIATGAGLVEAKNAVEAIEATLRATEPEKFTAPVAKGGCVSVLVLAFLAVLMVQFHANATPEVIGDYFKAQSQLKYVEVFHMDTMTETRADVDFRTLISAEHADNYVRFNRPDTMRDLYEALNGTVILDRTCDRFDMRWAIVLTYTDQTKEAVGFGRFYQCVKILSTGDRLAVSPGLFEYVLRTFPFMR